MSSHASLPWQEADSRRFIERGRVYTPRRDEIEATLLALVPAQPDEPFLAVELGPGTGWLSAALLRRFPQARVVGLDGSPAMLDATRQALAPYPGRFDLRPFRLEAADWRVELSNARVILSSLVVHHLDDAGKQRLFADLYGVLEPGGALLLADLVAPTSEAARAAYARAWDAEVRRQSVELTGDTAAYDEFVRTQWNLYDYPDPVDTPSPLPDQLRWLADLGYVGVDVFWLRAGHAVYGAYKPAGGPPHLGQRPPAGRP